MSSAADRRFRGRRGLAAAAVLLLLVGCTAGGTVTRSSGTTTRPSDDPTTTDGSSGPSTTTIGADPPVPDVQPIVWEDCAASTQCATVEAPVDYAEPDGPTLELAVTRRPAADPEQRIGALFVNPGGPGASAVEFAQGLPLPRLLGERFDLVGVDPRGVGGSTPLECPDHLLDIYEADPTMEDPADVEAYLEVSQAYVDDCAAEAGDLLPHLGTRDVARDMDLVRAAMGDDQLNYLGFSYGTAIGQAYAQLFPTHVRALVIDGVMDLSVDGLTAAATQAEGFETALAAFEADCDAESCLGESAAAAIATVIAAAESGGIPAGDREAGPGVVNLALGQAMYAEFLWTQLQDALADALEGDGTGLVDLADQYLQVESDGSYGQGFEIYFATGCLDLDYPRDPEAVLAAAEVAGKESPTFGEAIVNDYVRCALWPEPSDPLVPVPADTEGLPPTIVISTTRDPATPYENGVRAAEQIPDAILLTNEGDGHTAFTTGKDCVVDPVVTYFLDPADAPTDDLTCE